MGGRSCRLAGLGKVYVYLSVLNDTCLPTLGSAGNRFEKMIMGLRFLCKSNGLWVVV